MTIEWKVFDIEDRHGGEEFPELDTAEEWAKDRSLSGGTWAVYSVEVDDIYSIAHAGELYYK